MSKRSNERPRLLTAGYVTLDIIVRDLRAHDYWHAAGGTCGNVFDALPKIFEGGCLGEVAQAIHRR